MYTQSSLVTYIANNILITAAEQLGWGDTEYPGGSFDGIVGDIQAELGVADIAEVPDSKLELVNIIARKNAWYAVMSAYVTAYNISGAIRGLDREALFKHAEAMFKQAERDLLAYEVEDEIGTSRADIPPTTSIRAKLVYY